jgi:hypothetical protein
MGTPLRLLQKLTAHICGVALPGGPCRRAFVWKALKGPKLVRKSGSAHSTISPTCFPAGMTASELAFACLPKSECDTHARCRQKRFAYQRSLRILIPPYGGSNPGAPASQSGLCGVISSLALFDPDILRSAFTHRWPSLLSTPADYLDANHSLNFDQRRRPETLRTAMATAFF